MFLKGGLRAELKQETKLQEIPSWKASEWYFLKKKENLYCNFLHTSSFFPNGIN